MSDPAEIYAASLDSLRGADLVAPVEGLRRATTELCECLPPGVNGEQVEQGFPDLRTRLERCLAYGQPLLDFGGERGVAEATWMLQALGALGGESDNLTREPMLSLALHDLAWSVLADCLVRDSLEPIPRLAAVAISDPYESVPVPIFAAPGVRHTTAFNRGADRTFASWQEWLSTSDLIASMAHYSIGTRAAASLLEAELLTALCFAEVHGPRTFCAALEGSGERQLRMHLQGPARTALAEVFGVTASDLTGHVNELYSHLIGPDGFTARNALIPG